jgi:hypothetical protein
MSEYGKLATAAARAGWHVHQHVINNYAVTDLLDTLEQVNEVQPLSGLRWTLGHVYDISPANIARAKGMGMTLGVHGAAMQAGAHMPLRGTPQHCISNVRRHGGQRHYMIQTRRSRTAASCSAWAPTRPSSRTTVRS